MSRQFIISEDRLHQYFDNEISLSELLANEVPYWATHFARKETPEEIEGFATKQRMSMVYVEEIPK